MHAFPSPRLSGSRTKRHLVGIAAGLACWALASAAQAQETFKVGIVSFLSGQAAESFGIPAVNGAKVMIEAFNAGTAPAPTTRPASAA
jgi:branched-chain amino acid transport system substrate-binding protein